MRVRFGVAGDEEGFGVPYGKGKHPDSENVGYLDAKKNPAALAKFPELKGWPELEDFVREVNQPESLFRTLRCDVAASDVNHSGFTKKVSSYVTVAFEIVDWNRAQQPYAELYRAFCEFARGYPAPAPTFVEFELIPTSYREHGINRGWSVDVWSSGLGNTAEEARVHWQAGLRAAKEFLAMESA